MVVSDIKLSPRFLQGPAVGLAPLMKGAFKKSPASSQALQIRSVERLAVEHDG